MVPPSSVRRSGDGRSRDPGLRPSRVVRVGITFSEGVTSVVGTMSRRNKVPLVSPHLDGALIGSVVEQVALPFCRSLIWRY